MLKVTADMCTPSLSLTHSSNGRHSVSSGVASAAEAQWRTEQRAVQSGCSPANLRQRLEQERGHLATEWEVTMKVWGQCKIVRLVRGERG